MRLVYRTTYEVLRDLIRSEHEENIINSRLISVWSKLMELMERVYCVPFEDLSIASDENTIRQVDGIK